MDEYLDLLYIDDDNNAQKLQGLTKILELCKNPQNLPNLSYNHALMSALSRIMYEDSKRSIELAFHVCKIFYAFSNFNEMLQLLSKYKVGAHALEIVNLCVRRNHHRYEKIARRLWELDPTTNENRQKQFQIKKSIPKQKWINVSKQDHITFICLSLLINLAEDPNVEKKMVKNSLITHLTDSLDHKSKKCSSIIFRFLKKLSIYESNVNEMLHLHSVHQIIRVLCSTKDCNIIQTGLDVLFNISFSKIGRDQIMQSKSLPSFFTSHFRRRSLRSKILKLLYHLSIDSDTRAKLFRPKLMELIMKVIINTTSNSIEKVLAAVVINVS